MGFVNGDKVQSVIVAKLDQLTRDLMIQEHVVADLHRRGIKLVSALCSIDPPRMRQTMGAVAEYDISMIVLKLRGGQGMRARDGPCEGATPFFNLTRTTCLPAVVLP